MIPNTTEVTVKSWDTVQISRPVVRQVSLLLLVICIMLPGAGGRDGQWRRWEEAPSVLCPQLWRPKILHGVPTELLVSGVGSQDPTPRKHGSW